MNKFVIFTDPVSAQMPKDGTSIGSSLRNKGVVLPGADRPVVLLADASGCPALCVAYEPDPNVPFTNACMADVGAGISQFIERSDNCFVLFHAGSGRDPGRHHAQAAIFDGYYLFESDYRHARVAPYTLFCEAIEEPERIPELLRFLVNPAKIAEQIKLGARWGQLAPNEKDINWRALEAAYGRPLIEKFQTNVPTDHGELCDRLTDVVMKITNSFHG